MDLCEIARMERILQQDNGFLQRYFTKEEQAYLAARGEAASQSMAAMFAAKEALLKALGVGIGGGIPLVDIGIAHNEAGQPSYALAGRAAQALAGLGATHTWLSLTHEGGMAAAVAVVE